MGLISKKLSSVKLHFNINANAFFRVRLKKRSFDGLKNKQTSIAYFIGNLESLSMNYHLPNKYKTDHLYRIYVDILLYDKSKKKSEWINVNSISEDSTRFTLGMKDLHGKYVIPIKDITHLPSINLDKDIFSSFHLYEESSQLGWIAKIIAVMLSGKNIFETSLVDISNILNKVSFSKSIRINRSLIYSLIDFCNKLPSGTTAIDFISHNKRFNLAYHIERYPELMQDLIEDYSNSLDKSNEILNIRLNVLRYKPDFNLMVNNSSIIYSILKKNFCISREDFWIWQLYNVNNTKDIIYRNIKTNFKDYISSMKILPDLETLYSSVSVDCKTNNENLLPIQEISGMIFI